MTGINKKKSIPLTYSNLPSALWPVAQCDEFPIPVFKEPPDVPHENLDVSFGEQDDLNDNDFVPKISETIFFNQEELSNLIINLNLSKESSGLLVIKIFCKRVQKVLSTERDNRFLRFYEELPDFVIRIDTPGLFFKLCVNEYKAEERRLLIDSSKKTLSKCPGKMHSGGFPGW